MQIPQIFNLMARNSNGSDQLHVHDVKALKFGDMDLFLGSSILSLEAVLLKSGDVPTVS